MSLVSRSLSFNPCRILPFSSGFRRDCGGSCFSNVLRNHRLARTQHALSTNVVSAELVGDQWEPYPSPGVVEVSTTGFQMTAPQLKDTQTNVALNEAAPAVGSVFAEGSTKEVTLLEDPVGFVRYRWDKKLQYARKALAPLEESVAPSPYSPTQGDDVVVFFLVSMALIFLFWVGNYLAPTWIFKETVFRNASQNSDDNFEEYGQDDKPSTAKEDEVDPADLIQLPPNLRAFTPAAVAGFKAGRQKAREEEEERRRKKSGKRK
ncbi:uncharacterized protein [Physcomitrium patens]|uniref:Transmembrane protein n=1 Tax=Physcomitrium patens TaxID=3218 RepID=A0A2K1L4F0_PHYPA|nr:uncharacterized protein LOC112279145 [Physcomitrium patens]PNR60897.1 hypothetical protein PHYPA_003690 [Physcomitrium patens]|eukprot:XP_024369067.1 uncharacterized protein LOC112279145 [Physcomitrella patens]